MLTESESPPPVLVEVIRNGVLESSHRGHISGLDEDGNLVQHLGEVGRPRFGRSVLKPVQAVAMLAAGLDLDDHLLALVAGSHPGEPHHTEGALDILTGAGLDASAMRNPAALAMGCSGKHAGMLATCVLNGWDLDSYLSANHPLQQAICACLTRLAGEPPAAVGVDGCGAPTFAVSLTGLARAFRALVLAAPGTPERRVADAMRKHPTWSSGAERPDARLMMGIPGVLAKDGAEGFGAAALPDGRSVAVKVDDGQHRALAPLFALALTLIGAHAPTVSDLSTTPLFGGGERVGVVCAVIRGA
jgi:L-asparaginase II